jgi:hypothetical protein
MAHACRDPLDVLLTTPALIPHGQVRANRSVQGRGLTCRTPSAIASMGRVDPGGEVATAAHKHPELTRHLRAYRHEVAP